MAQSAFFVAYICYFVKFILHLQQQAGEVRTSGSLPQRQKTTTTNRIILLPYPFKRIGWALFIPTALFGILMAIDGFNGFPSFLLPGDAGSSSTLDAVSNNIVLIGVLAGSLLITCSRERIEDELIGRIRLNALLVALYINILWAVIASLALYNLDYLYVMVINLVSLPILFLIIERVLLWRLRKEASHEE